MFPLCEALSSLWTRSPHPLLPAEASRPRFGPGGALVASWSRGPEESLSHAEREKGGRRAALTISVSSISEGLGCLATVKCVCACVCVCVCVCVCAVLWSVCVCVTAKPGEVCVHRCRAVKCVWVPLLTAWLRQTSQYTEQSYLTFHLHVHQFTNYMAQLYFKKRLSYWDALLKSPCSQLYQHVLISIRTGSDGKQQPYCPNFKNTPNTKYKQINSILILIKLKISWQLKSWCGLSHLVVAPLILTY